MLTKFGVVFGGVSEVIEDAEFCAHVSHYKVHDAPEGIENTLSRVTESKKYAYFDNSR